MAKAGPVRQGFRAVFRAPGLVFAEITWRWAFGAVCGAALAFAGIEFLDSLQVSDRDLLFLRSMVPPLMADAVRNILAGSGFRLLRTVLVLAPALALFWMAAAAVGRGITLGALLRRDCTLRNCWRALLSLSFLRAGLMLAAVTGVFGAALIARLVIPQPDANAVAVVLLMVALLLVVGFFWSVLNWFLGLAAIFAVRDGHDGLRCVAEAVALFRRRGPVLISAGIPFGLLRYFAMLMATVCALLTAAAIGGESVKAMVVGCALISLLYLAVADFLYIARLAAYVAIAEEGPEEAAVVPPVSLAPEQPEIATV